MLVELVVGDAGDERGRPVGQARLRGPAHIGAAVVAAEEDHAAGVERARLRPDRDRLELLGIAVAAVDERAQRVDGVDPALVDEAELRLVDGLARVERDRRRIDAARIGLELGARQAERILRLRQGDAVDDERHAVGVVAAR